jgi:SAM-dependent methyltransferase
VMNAFFDCAEAERLPYPDNIFNFVTCQFAFHHMPRPEATLSEMVRVTKPGGRVYLVDSIGPEDAHISELHNHIEKLRDPSHTSTLSLRAFLVLFVSQGLRMLKQRILDRPRSFNQWMVRAGHWPSDASYRAVRQVLEHSMESDRAGFAARVAGGDITVMHQEGLFLIAKPMTPPAQ